jgi:hypothetical protein
MVPADVHPQRIRFDRERSARNLAMEHIRAYEPLGALFIDTEGGDRRQQAPGVTCNLI